MTPTQRKHFEYVRDVMHGEPEQPPQRSEASKPLTDEQISEIGYRVYGMKSSTDIQYARAIEAAHGIT